MDNENKRFDIDFIKESFHPSKIQLNTGDILFSEGESNDYVYFIEAGSIKVLKSKWVIGITKANEFVGMTSCISENYHYTFSTKAVEKSEVLRINKSEFKELLLNNSKFCKQIIEILCERIKLTDLKTRSFIEQTSQHRLINELINNSKKIENSIKAFLGIDDLSELTGVSKRAVGKMLNDLSKDKLIHRNNKNEITLLDQQKLQSLIQKTQSK